MHNPNYTKLGLKETLTFEAPNAPNLLTITNLGPPLELIRYTPDLVPGCGTRSMKNKERLMEIGE